MLEENAKMMKNKSQREALITAYAALCKSKPESRADTKTKFKAVIKSPEKTTIMINLYLAGYKLLPQDCLDLILAQSKKEINLINDGVEYLAKKDVTPLPKIQALISFLIALSAEPLRPSQQVEAYVKAISFPKKYPFNSFFPAETNQIPIEKQPSKTPSPN